MIAEIHQNNNPHYLDPLKSIFNEDFNYASDDPDISFLVEEILGLENDFGDRDELISKVKANQLNWVLDGIRLHIIQKHKLYLHKYKSFKDFVKYELKRSPHNIRLKIIGANVCLQLIGLGYEDLPHNISQATAVFECASEELPIGLIWKQVLDTYEPWQITRKKIIALFKPSCDFIEPENKFVMLPWSLYKKLAALALGARKSIIQYLDDVITSHTKVEFYLLFKLIMMSG